MARFRLMTMKSREPEIVVILRMPKAEFEKNSALYRTLQKLATLSRVGDEQAMENLAKHLKKQVENEQEARSIVHTLNGNSRDEIPEEETQELLDRYRELRPHDR